jgi:hypothetical protein
MDILVDLLKDLPQGKNSRWLRVRCKRVRMPSGPGSSGRDAAGIGQMTWGRAKVKLCVNDSHNYSANGAW